MCSVLSSTAWINDWCSRPQVKVREVHYWIISALLSLLPSAWLLLVDVVEALEGTPFLLMHWNMNACCVNPVRMFCGLFSTHVTNITQVFHNKQCTHSRTRKPVCSSTLCCLLVPIYQTVDNDSRCVCFQTVVVLSAFILMEPSEFQGNMLLDRASFAFWFCFAVSQAGRLHWTHP